MYILGMIDCPIWMLCTGGVIVTFVLYSKWKQRILGNLGIPGPKPALFFGILPSYKKKGIALTDLELVTKYGNVVGIYHGNTPNILIADPEMIEEICVKQFDNFKNRSSVMDLGSTLRQCVAMSTDSKWDILREKLLNVFSTSNTTATTELLHVCTNNLMEKVKEKSGESFDVTSLCRSYSVDAIANLVFGMDINTHKNPENKMAEMTNKAYIAGTVGLLKKSTICAIFPAMRHVYRTMNINPLPDDVVDYFIRITNSGIAERQKHNSNHRDFLKHMMSCRISNGHTGTKEMSEEEIMSNCIFFIMAGYDTTATALAFVLYCLATNPSWQEKLTNEIDEKIKKDTPTYEEVMNLECLDAVTSETFRLYPPFLRFNRESKHDTCIKGHKIPAGVHVQFPVFAVHRNPEFWDNPDMFDPERFYQNNETQHRYTYIPFGCGKRNCFGCPLALLEIKMAVVRLLQEFKFTQNEDTEVPLTFEKSGFLRPENGIYLTASGR